MRDLARALEILRALGLTREGHVRLGGLRLSRGDPDVRLRLGQAFLLVAIVELNQELSAAHRLIGIDQNPTHALGNLAGYVDLVGVDLCVVGRLMRVRVRQVADHEEEDDQRHDHARDDEQVTALRRDRVLDGRVAAVGRDQRWCDRGTRGSHVS